jgi:dolichyl-diphosphooligosaccharide--protein glycosyltransferase
MTAYPGGKQVDWGPLFPFLAAVLCLVTGASTQVAVVSVSGYVSPLLAVLLVPVLYGLGTMLGDEKTGLVAAGLAAVTSLLYFSYSLYGMVDHHIAEVFFSTLFFLVYARALTRNQKNPVNLHDTRALLAACSLPALAGVVYFLGLVTSTTVILALLVIAVYTLVQGVADFHDRKNPDYLCLVNLVFLGVATVLYLLFGFKAEGISFSQYTVGIVYLHLAVMAGTIGIRALSGIFRGNRSGFIISIAAFFVGLGVICLVVPAARSVAGQAGSLLFGFSVYSIGVQETLPWSWANAFDNLNLGIFLAAGGFLVLAWQLRMRRDPVPVLVLVWSILMLLITIQHQRFLYYFTANIVLLAALGVTEPLRWKNNPVSRQIAAAFSPGEPGSPDDPTRNDPPAAGKSPKKKKQGPSGAPGRNAGQYAAACCIIAVLFLAGIHGVLSFGQDYQYAATAGDREIPADWIASLNWLKDNTPDPGVDYFGRYDRNSYVRPAGSYGIMAVWDAGHWITFFAHRMPITNPFQDNLGGAKGTAAFFLGENESAASSILNGYGGKYVITDSVMAVDRFTNLVPWESGSTDISPYIRWFLIPDTADPQHLKKIHQFRDAYFQTMVVRLHLFDGSLTEPTTAEYTQYNVRLPTAQETADTAGYSRVIAGRKTVNVTELDSTTPILPEGEELLPTGYADIFSVSPDRPLREVPALTGYRLVYESAHDASVSPFPESSPAELPGIKMVKIFESVKGAHIAGSGIIEVPIVTNTGRVFTYRQRSTGGEFIVPYSTTKTSSGVHATGPYHIIGTASYFPVTEDEVLNGKTVQVSR